MGDISSMRNTTNTVKAGRPEQFPVKFQMAMDTGLRDAVDAWRSAQRPIPPRSEALRLILRDWLVGHGYLPAPTDEDD
jgi:hypothetical protein